MALLLRPKKPNFSFLKHLSTIASSFPLTPAESKLLDNLYNLLLDHHRSNPPLPSITPPSPSLTISSLATSFSDLSPSPPSPSLAHGLIRRVTSLRRGHPFVQTLSFFNWYVSNSPPPESSSLSDIYTAMIDLSGKIQHFSVARQLLDKMHSLSIPISSLTLTTLLRRYVRAGLPEEAANLFRRLPEYGLNPNPSILTSLLASLSKKRLAQEAQSLFDSFKSLIPPDVFLYSSLIHAWCRAGRLDEAERIFAEMKSVGISPNVYTYTCIIDAMCREGQLPRAQELLCQMIDTGCPPNTATFNALMRVHVKAGRTEQVLQIHNQMKRLGCEPDTITYTFLIETHCRKNQGNLDAALTVLNQMVAKGCVPDCHSFNPIFKLVVGSGNVDAAHKLFEKMRELNCKPNTVTYNLLLELFSKDNKMDMVLKLKKEMEMEGVEPNVNTYSVLISVFCERGNWRRAYDSLKEMVEFKCLKPTDSVYKMVMDLLSRAAQFKKHQELTEMMIQRGFVSSCKPDSKTML